MDKKRIKILTKGPIRVKGFINGPVLTPYFEDISTIFAMVSQGVHIVEVCDDKTEIRLNVNNVTEDNSKAAREEKQNLLQPKVEPEKVEVEQCVDNATVDSVDTVAEVNDDVKVEPEKVNNQNNYNKHHNTKHNKHNKK